MTAESPDSSAHKEAKVRTRTEIKTTVETAATIVETATIEVIAGPQDRGDRRGATADRNRKDRDDRNRWRPQWT